MMWLSIGEIEPSLDTQKLALVGDVIWGDVRGWCVAGIHGPFMVGLGFWPDPAEYRHWVQMECLRLDPRLTAKLRAHN